MASADTLKRAANNILTRSLGLRKDHSLLIFADSGSVAVAEVVARAARDLGIVSSVVFVPRFLQADIGTTESLPLPVEAAVREADAVLSCLSDRPEHFPYRLRLLRTSWSRRAKLAHAPGLTLDILCKADTDYALIAERCRQLALALILGRQMEITTLDSQGHAYRLGVEIGSWDYPPAISDGIIPDGAWGNVPPGETFIVPQNGEGRIAVNGSLPGRVLGPGEDLVLTFGDAQLIEIQPKGSAAARHLTDTQITYAQERGDSDWPNLAEIGFGVNPAIRQLIGTPLSDCKKANTLHIALGHSASLGGNVDSIIHCDLAIERPTVRINGRPLLEGGRWRMEEADWRLDHRTVTVPQAWWQGLTGVRRSAMRVERERDGLVCRWNAGRGRWDTAPVGAEQTARLTARLYDLLPEGGETMTRPDLLAAAERMGLEQAIVPALLWIMCQYDVVRIPRERQLVGGDLRS